MAKLKANGQPTQLGLETPGGYSQRLSLSEDHPPLASPRGWPGEAVQESQRCRSAGFSGWQEALGSAGALGQGRGWVGRAWEEEGPGGSAGLVRRTQGGAGFGGLAVAERRAWCACCLHSLT